MKLAFYHNRYLHGCYKMERENTFEPLSDKDFVSSPSGGDLILIDDGQLIEAKKYLASLSCHISSSADKDGFRIIFEV